MPVSGRVLRAAAVMGGTLALLAGCSLGGTSHPAPPTEPLPTAAPPPVGSIDHPRPVECADGTAYDGTHPGRERLAVPPAGTTAGTTALKSPPTGGRSADPSSAYASSVYASAPASPAPPASPASPGAPSKGGKGGVRSGGAEDDVTVGPLTWKGLRTMTGGDQDAHGVVNSGGWHYRAAPEVAGNAVVTVTVGAEVRARAGLEYGGGYGNTPAPSVTFHGCQGTVTSFFGGFFIAGDGRACVPLDVKVGDEPARHVVVSFFKGPCPA